MARSSCGTTGSGLLEGRCERSLRASLQQAQGNIHLLCCCCLRCERIGSLIDKFEEPDDLWHAVASLDPGLCHLHGSLFPRAQRSQVIKCAVSHSLAVERSTREVLCEAFASTSRSHCKMPSETCSQHVVLSCPAHVSQLPSGLFPVATTTRSKPRSHALYRTVGLPCTVASIGSCSF